MTITSHCRGFVLLDRIGTIDENIINGAVFLPNNVPLFWVIEAMAQLGGMHARFMHDFNLHVFLLKINRLDFLSQITGKGWYFLWAELRAASDKAFSYRVRMTSPQDSTLAEGMFCFASRDYDHVFQEDKLKNHYKELFTCLRTNSNGVC